MRPLDYSIYNKVKAKFPPQPGLVIFVSLAPENLEELAGLSFTVETIDDLGELTWRYEHDLMPYACIGGFIENKAEFVFCCKEFQQEEDLITGKILASSIGTYHKQPVDIEAVKRDLKKLSCGIESFGNA